MMWLCSMHRNHRINDTVLIIFKLSPFITKKTHVWTTILQCIKLFNYDLLLIVSKNKLKLIDHVINKPLMVILWANK